MGVSSLSDLIYYRLNSRAWETSRLADTCRLWRKEWRGKTFMTSGKAFLLKALMEVFSEILLCSYSF